MLGKGYSPVDYTLLCYGGGGPLHVAGYTAGVPYRDVLVPAWAAGFSAFGCACGDFAYRSDLHDRHADRARRRRGPAGSASGCYVDGGWQMLRERVVGGVREVGRRRGRDRVPPLRAHAVLRPAQRPRDLLAASGDRGGRARRRPDRRVRGRLRQALRALGALARAGLPGHERDRHRRRAEVEKPALPDERRGRRRGRARREPAGLVARRLARDAALRAGPDQGRAVGRRARRSIESPADTFAIPPGRRARLDAHRIFHLETPKEPEHHGNRRPHT